MSDRGFTIVELLVATLIVLGIAGVVVALAGPMRDSLDRGLSGAGVATRGRTGLELLVGELRQSGTSATIGAESPTLADLTAVVMPLASAGGSYHELAVLRVPHEAAQAVLRSPAAAGDSILQLDPAGPCPRQDGTCGFHGGAATAIYDAARLERVIVAAVSAETASVALATPLTASFEAGAVVASVDTASYTLRSAVDGGMRLVRLTVGGAEQPVADHIVDFDIWVFGTASSPMPREDDTSTYGPSPPAIGVDDLRDSWPAGENCTLTADADGRRVSRMPHLGAAETLVRLEPAALADGPWCPDAADPQRFDADLLRIRRVDIRLRVESPDRALRGPIGRWFRRGGTARGANTWVPDIEVRTSATMRGR